MKDLSVHERITRCRAELRMDGGTASIARDIVVIWS